jgi:hypothetical protein
MSVNLTAKGYDEGNDVVDVLRRRELSAPGTV